MVEMRTHPATERAGLANPPPADARASAPPDHGVLGGIGFGSATWQLRARDDWIGWSVDAGAANIGRVLCNHRFLLLPGVRAYALASRVLGMATQRVADDWESR